MQQKKDFFINALHIFVLFSFALAQPLFDLLSRNVEFFVARHSRPVDVILLVLILCILLPAIVVLFEVVAGLFGRVVRKYVHTIAVACLVSLIALQILKRIEGVPGTAFLIGAAVLGAAAAITYIRFKPVQMFLTVLSPAILIFPGLFIFNPQVSKVVFAEATSDAVYAKIDATAPVVMVIFDEFPITSLMNKDRRIDPVLYPNFAALSQDAYWFRNATTVAESTLFAIPAILSSSYLDKSRVPTASDYPRNLFTLLGGSYRMSVLESHTMLCPETLCKEEEGFRNFIRRAQTLLLDLSVVYLHMSLPEDLTAKLPVVTQTWKDFWGETRATAAKAPDMDDVMDKARASYKDRPGLFAKFVESITKSDKPTLYFLHIMLPHVPWQYLPSGKRYTITGGEIPGLNIKKEQWGDDDWLVIQGYQRHLLQVGFVDKLVGGLLDRLKTLNLYDRSLIVITADHGVSFWPNKQRRNVSKEHPMDIMSIPLFIKVPDQNEGVISDRNVETIDILPTIADILDINLPWPVDGRSVLDLSLPERSEKIIDNYRYERFVFDSVLDPQNAALKRQLALFGSGANPDGLFKIGPHSELIGRDVNEFGVVGDASVTARLDQAPFFANVDPKAAFANSRITGRVFLNGKTGGKLNLAISVNGTIRAVTRAFPLAEGVAEWSAMVPETAFRAGRNDVEVFIVSTDSDGQLNFMRTRSQRQITYSFSLSSKTLIRYPDGASMQIIPNALQGWVSTVVRADYVEFTGWAADVKNSKIPEAVVVFVNGKFVYSAGIDMYRPDVAKHLDNPALQRTGFKFVLPSSLFEDTTSPEVRVFAVSKEGVASELNYPKGYKWGKGGLKHRDTEAQRTKTKN